MQRIRGSTRMRYINLLLLTYLLLLLLMVSDRGRNVNNVGIWLCFDELLIWNVHNQMNLFIDNSRVIAEKYSIAIRYRCQRYFLQLL